MRDQLDGARSARPPAVPSRPSRPKVLVPSVLVVPPEVEAGAAFEAEPETLPFSLLDPGDPGGEWFQDSQACVVAEAEDFDDLDPVSDPTLVIRDRRKKCAAGMAAGIAIAAFLGLLAFAAFAGSEARPPSIAAELATEHRASPTVTRATSPRASTPSTTPARAPAKARARKGDVVVSKRSDALTSARKHGYLSIGAKPPCRIYVDGKYKGMTPRRAMKVSPGVRRVVLKSEDGNITRGFRVRIRPGRTVRIVKDFLSARGDARPPRPS